MFKGQSIRFLAGAAFTSVLVGSAVADMVYDDENSMSAAPTKVEVKNVINTPNAPAPISATATANSNSSSTSNAMTTETISTPPVIVETQKIQKQSDKARERRGFQESVNNELVIQKLEDKRLKQEEKLTAEINKKFTLEDDETAAANAGTPAPVVKQEVIVKPITETPGAEVSATTEMSPAPKAEAVAAKPIVQDQIVNYQSSTSMTTAPTVGKSEGEEASKNGVSVIPTAGLSTISNDFYDFKNQYTAGVALGLNASDNISVSLGYAYSDYQVGCKTPANYVGYTYNPLTFKNNTFDLAMKLYLTGQDAKLRPFVGGGAGYSFGYVNYNRSPYTYSYYPSNDYQLNQVLGSLQAGFEIKVASNVAVGFTYKYFKPISTTESDDGLYSGAFYSYPGYGFYDPNAQKQFVRGTLRDSTSQMFLLNASVTF